MLNNIVTIVKDNKLLSMNQDQLNGLKNLDKSVFDLESSKLYKNSLYSLEGVLYFIAKVARDKALFLVSESQISSDFKGDSQSVDGVNILKVPMNYKNSVVLKKLFPFTQPISLREKKTTVGCGDRLGLATPGHIRACKKYDVYPVLAQQSIRELNFTNRKYSSVTSDAAFLVFQEGFERGYGADGDHLKTIADIDVALEAGMPMITLDLSEVMNADAADWSPDKIEQEFNALEDGEKTRILNAYAGKSFLKGENEIQISEAEAKKCTVMYKKALDFAKEVDLHLRKHRGDQYDLEISIDETTTPTLPEHHLFIIKELLHREVVVNSLAPRFIGDFQKGIDYIGDKQEFEKQFKIHCEIALANGHYKVSVHSGSDKFSVYPVIGKYTGMRLHLKTAGTSWLEAVRCVAKCNPSFYRKLHKKAFFHFKEASNFYHITADLSKIQDIDNVSDDNLGDYLNQDESRQLIHITYGGLLNDPEIREDFFNTLDDFEDEHYAFLEKHIGKHIELLGTK